MRVLASLTGLVAHQGYLGVFVLVFVEGFGVPAPGETAIILGAGYAARGELNIVGVAAAAFLAAVGGDSVGYLIGRTGGRPLILRYGRYVRLTPGRLARIEAFMGRHGPKVVAIARFVEGLRQFNGVIAGATGMPWRRFVAYNAVGAAAWVGVWATAGYLAGDHIRAIEAELHRYQWYVIPAAALVVIGYAGWHLVLRRRRRQADPR
jgi:membrane protein DedA with SNARE-associated domain